jgi:hypothetical protein
MAAESGKETGHPEAGQDPVESFTDDLIREFFADAGQSARSAGRSRSAMAALLDATMASSRGPSRASMFERFLIAQSIASELADAIAPALAETLAPEIMKALEHYTTDESGRKEPTPATRTRRTETK